MKYFVTVGTTTMVVDIDGDQVSVDGTSVTASIASPGHSPEIVAIIDGVLHRVALDREADGVWRLVDDGVVYDVRVEDERRRHIRLLAGAARVHSGDAVLKAPMPGLVVRILVSPGDRVAAGAPLIALEAMKMENELKAVAPGVVTAVRVVSGQVVEKGQVLIELAEVAGAES
jgi:pyruvate carboxylase subunit B